VWRFDLGVRDEFEVPAVGDRIVCPTAAGDGESGAERRTRRLLARR
jgi:hypothetical protein